MAVLRHRIKAPSRLAARSSSAGRQALPHPCRRSCASSGSHPTAASAASWSTNWDTTAAACAFTPNAQAADSAHTLRAAAYTVGRDVVFGEGLCAPTAPTGSRLLAHVVRGFRLGTLPLNQTICEALVAACARAELLAPRTRELSDFPESTPPLREAVA
jgi:Domain of unknown function (DUF4157)